MKEKRIITKEMVDYVENHRDGNVRYDKSFVIKEGEECTVDGVSSVHENCIKISFADGRACVLPADLFDIDPIAYASMLENERKREKYNRLVDWNGVRIKAATAALQGICSNGKILQSIPEKVANVCVVLADTLIKELQK